MSDLKGILGPWEALVGRGSPTVQAGDMLICQCRGWGYLTGKGHAALGLPHDEAATIQDANAYLIASAPDLYAALDEAVKLTEVATMRAVGTANWLPKARTVLAKARGES